MQQPTATWNPKTQLWERPASYGRLVPYSETFPKSGTTRDGQLWPLPMSVRPTDATGCSSSQNVVLLPTPRTRDGKGSTAARRGDNGHDLPSALAPNHSDPTRPVWATPLASYLPAVHRWERVTGRPAPQATEANRSGNPRLTAAFAEWLMGWPAGHITDPALGITYKNQLRLTGNGVVVQQAVAAITALLGR